MNGVPFTSRLSRLEGILVLAYLPLHLVVLQLVFASLAAAGTLSAATANFLFYATGFVYMLLSCFRFLRRDFDPLADAPLRCVREILSGYVGMLCCNLVVGGILLLLTPGSSNLNNENVLQTVQQNTRLMKAAVIFLGPVVEEMMFRAGIFGLLRRKSRLAAYIVSALCFSLYHVAPYAVLDVSYWLYLLQYFPVSLLLARCYERTNSIWCSIFFHMLVNGLALSALL